MVKVKISTLLVFIFFILAFNVFIYGSGKFWIGFHNTDLCANQMVMSEMYDLDIKETKVDGKIWEFKRMLFRWFRENSQRFLYLDIRNVFNGCGRRNVVF